MRDLKIYSENHIAKHALSSVPFPLPQAPNPSTGQPTFPGSSLEFSQPQRLDLPSPDLVGSLLGHLPGTYDSFVAPQPSAKPNPNMVTYDLREGLARPAPADSDKVYRRLLLTLL
jgi:hypothetical protein